MRLRLATGAVLVTAAMAVCGCTQTEQQRRISEIAIVRNERQPVLLQSRGDAAAVMGDLTRAEQYFAAALAAGGDERLLTRRLLVVCSLDERYPAAAAHAEDYLRKHPGDTETRYALATVYVAMGDVGKALSELRRVVAERPGIADAHYALATMLRQQGDALMDADLHFREYIRLRPDGPYAEAARASLLRAVP